MNNWKLLLPSPTVPGLGTGGAVGGVVPQQKAPGNNPDKDIMKVDKQDSAGTALLLSGSSGGEPFAQQQQQQTMQTPGAQTSPYTAVVDHRNSKFAVKIIGHNLNLM